MQINEYLQIPPMFIKPQFPYENLHRPTWHLPTIKVNTELSLLSKATTATVAYKQTFMHMMNQTYPNYSYIFTDGSKSERGVGSAAITQRTSRSQTLPKEASIYTAEMHALQLALSIIQWEGDSKYVICSDSIGALKTLTGREYLPHAMAIINEVSKLLDTGKTVEFCWVPGHVGIAGNERADKLAKQAAAANCEIPYFPLPVSDAHAIATAKVRELFNAEWAVTGRNLVQLKSSLGPWKHHKSLNRRGEVVINRLRAGHTFITHGYLMDPTRPDIPPLCEFCQDAVMSVQHVLLSCSALTQERAVAFGSCNRESNLNQLLGDIISPITLIEYLKRIDIYKVI